jgi:hypothetical protein
MDLGEICGPIVSIRRVAITNVNAYLIWNPTQGLKCGYDLMQRIDQLERQFIERSISLSIDGGRNVYDKFRTTFLFVCGDDGEIHITMRGTVR